MGMSKTFLKDRDIARAQYFAAQIKQRVQPSADFVFSPGTLPIAYLESKKPKVFYTDAAFAGMIDYYPEFSNLCAETIRDGNLIEQLALDSCSLAIYSSDWAAQSAIKHYKVAADKVAVIPFGANIECTRNINDIKSIVRNRQTNTCRLLLVGVNWKRKGGDIAMEVAARLNKNGLPTELHIVGMKEIPHKTLPKYVKSHGFISKSTPEGIAALEKLFMESSFLIVPSRFEAFGIVFCEASSFGLPSLATRTGGIPTAIHDNSNGMTFNADADPEQYVQYIQDLFTDRKAYEQLALSSFNEYQTRLNWQVNGKLIIERMNAI